MRGEHIRHAAHEGIRYRSRELEALVPAGFRPKGDDDVQPAAAGCFCEALEVDRSEQLPHEPRRIDNRSPVHLGARIEVDDEPIGQLDGRELLIPRVHFKDVHLYQADER